MIPNLIGRDGGNAGHAAHMRGGLIAGAVVLTADGEIPVEYLTPGDRIVTRDTGLATLRAIQTRQGRGDAVAIMAGSLGHTRPQRDVLLAADQPILIRDWRAAALMGTRHALIPASRLVDGEFVTLHRDLALTIHAIAFDQPHVIYVDGLELAAGVLTPSLAAVW